MIKNQLPSARQRLDRTPSNYQLQMRTGQKALLLAAVDRICDQRDHEFTQQGFLAGTVKIIAEHLGTKMPKVLMQPLTNDYHIKPKDRLAMKAGREVNTGNYLYYKQRRAISNAVQRLNDKSLWALWDWNRQCATRPGIPEDLEYDEVDEDPDDGTENCEDPRFVASLLVLRHADNAMAAIYSHQTRKGYLGGQDIWDEEFTFGRDSSFDNMDGENVDVQNYAKPRRSNVMDSDDRKDSQDPNNDWMDEMPDNVCRMASSLSIPAVVRWNEKCSEDGVAAGIAAAELLPFLYKGYIYGTRDITYELTTSNDLLEALVAVDLNWQLQHDAAA